MTSVEFIQTIIAREESKIESLTASIVEFERNKMLYAGALQECKQNLEALKNDLQEQSRCVHPGEYCAQEKNHTAPARWQIRDGIAEEIK